jgi:hypothetical protein
MRESDVIVLMVSPLLALRLVIDHNTEQRTEFPRFFHHDRAWITWKCPIEQAPPNPYGESMQATYSRATTERIVGNSESPQVELIGGFFGHRAGMPAFARAYACASQALLRPHFSYFLCHNSDFGRSGRCVPRGRIRFGSSQNPGCGAVRSDAVARRSLRDFTD